MPLYGKTCAAALIAFGTLSLRRQQPLRVGKLKIAGARYDLDEGKVDLFV